MRILTWNIQGGRKPDLAVLHEILCEHAPDVVLLQEVERAQARRLASIGDWTWRWRFKHWPVVRPTQGQAVLARYPLRDDDVIVLARRWVWCSWRRRIATAVSVADDGATFRVVNAHLGSGVTEDRRVRQARRMLAALDGGGCVILAGDLNAGHDAPTLRTLRRSGLTDRPAGPDGGADGRADHRGPTNWPAGPRTGPPTQWLDHVFVGPDLVIGDVRVPVPSDPGWERYPVLSDHIPVVAEVHRRRAEDS